MVRQNPQSKHHQSSKKVGSKKRKQEDMDDSENNTANTSFQFIKQLEANSANAAKKDEAKRRKTQVEQKNAEAQAKAQTSSAIKSMSEKIGREHKAVAENMLDEVTNTHSTLSKHFNVLEQDVANAKQSTSTLPQSMEKLQSTNVEMKQIVTSQLQQHEKDLHEHSKKTEAYMGKIEKGVQKQIETLADAYAKELRTVEERLQRSEQDKAMLMTYITKSLDTTSSCGSEDDDSSDDGSDDDDDM